MYGPELTFMLAFLVVSLAVFKFEQAPRCIECSAKFRHRADCRTQR